MVKVAINGFGRIGRMVFRAAHKDPEIEFVLINDPGGSPELLVDLLKRDSTQGPFDGTAEVKDGQMIIDGKAVKLVHEKDPSNLQLDGVDVVMECSGFFRNREGAQKFLDAGAKKVFISAPAKDPDITIVKGVNDDQYDKEKHHIISNASCTTNSLAPVVKVLNDNYGVEFGLMTTIHSYTGDQRVLDAGHKDMRRARAAAINMIPTTTGAAKAVTEVIPELKGKLHGHAVRVPTPTGSITDFTCVVKKEVTQEEVNALLKSCADGVLKNIMAYTEDPIVSSDIVHDPHSTIIDGQLTVVMEGKMVKIMTWYDNEWGYSNRMAELVKNLL